MAGGTYNSDPFTSPDNPATMITLSKKNYVDTFLYGLPITATPPNSGQVPILNITSDGWDWQDFNNTETILYQVADTANPTGNIIYKIGSDDESSRVDCSEVEIDIITNGVVNISGGAGASLFSVAGAASLIGVGGINLESNANIELKINGGGDFKFTNLNTASNTNILYIDPTTGVITKSTPPPDGVTTLTDDVTGSGTGTIPTTVVALGGIPFDFTGINNYSVPIYAFGAFGYGGVPLAFGYDPLRTAVGPSSSGTLLSYTIFANDFPEGGLTESHVYGNFSATLASSVTIVVKFAGNTIFTVPAAELISPIGSSFNIVYSIIHPAPSVFTTGKALAQLNFRSSDNSTMLTSSYQWIPFSVINADFTIDNLMEITVTTTATGRVTSWGSKTYFIP
jgi:hypothetical protein